MPNILKDKDLKSRKSFQNKRRNNQILVFVLVLQILFFNCLLYILIHKFSNPPCSNMSTKT